MQSIHSILKEYWGYSGFRPLQEDIINSVLKGEDSLALLPTGGGKSICFQVPAMAMKGLCLVVTPLIALMKDQVENLRKKGITAFSIYSGMSRKEVISTLETAGNSNCKFLYVSPERLETNIFKEYLPSLGIQLIAVDEAHCISQWGYDFRPSYLRISALREELQGVPVLALTASATPEVQQDICKRLLFKKDNIFRQSFGRPNLSYSVFDVPAKINKVADVLSKVNGTGIVYCRSRRKTKEISDLLNLKGIPSDFYHAGLSQQERNNIQESWLKDKTRVIVCTNAFGMGIDKPGVRVVVHVDVPECLENYYQEAGRAGRDGNKAYAVLLANGKEIKALEAAADKKFPGQDEIRKIYKALMNHLQIPSGLGEGHYYDLDAPEFIKNFKLDASVVLSALKTFEQEELLYFNEQVFIQSKLQVVASREHLLEFEKEYPELGQVIKSVLRTFEGVIDQQVNINEKYLASILKKSEAETITLLTELARFYMVEYIPRKEKPQVYLFQNRVKAEDLKINIELYHKRKKLYQEKIKAMTSYVYTLSLCRSVMIGKYFGDDSLQPCGICDNCINKKKKDLSNAEFDTLSSRVINEINMHSPTMSELQFKLNAVPKDKVKEVIHFLQSEEKILVSGSGKMTLKNTSLPASTS